MGCGLVEISKSTSKCFQPTGRKAIGHGIQTHHVQFQGIPLARHWREFAWAPLSAQIWHAIFAYVLVSLRKAKESPGSLCKSAKIRPAVLNYNGLNAMQSASGQLLTFLTIVDISIWKHQGMLIKIFTTSCSCLLLKPFDLGHHSHTQITITKPSPQEMQQFKNRVLAASGVTGLNGLLM